MYSLFDFAKKMTIKRPKKWIVVTTSVICFYIWSAYTTYNNKESFGVLCEGTTRYQEIDADGSKSEKKEKEVKTYYFDHQSLTNYECNEWQPEFISCKGDESKIAKEQNGDFLKVNQYLRINRITGEVHNNTERVQSKSGKIIVKNVTYSGFCKLDDYQSTDGKVL